LDIGLPILNGTQAAKQISEFCPKSKILFLTGEYLPEIAEQLLNMGAHGYVLKSNASKELLPAIEAVLSGQRFVSSAIAARTPALIESARSHSEHAREAVANNEILNCHEALFCSDERALLDRVTVFIGNALKAGSAGVVLATGAHRDRLLSRLQGFGVHIPTAVEQGRYLAFDSEEALTAFMLNGVLDRDRFLNLFRTFITAARGSTNKPHSRIAVFGECVDLLWANGNAEAAIQMERVGNELTRQYEVNILCGYSLSHGKMHPDIHRLICEQHSAVHAI
jgi:hypothetical protein